MTYYKDMNKQAQLTAFEIGAGAYFRQCFKRGQFDRLENGVGIYDLTADERRDLAPSFPEIVRFSRVEVTPYRERGLHVRFIY